LSDVSEIADLAAGKATVGVVAHGCESIASDAPPAYVIGVPIVGSGSIVVCMPLDSAYLKNSSDKLGLQLALANVDPAAAPRLIGGTPAFPQAAFAAFQRESKLVDEGDRAWAVARFQPKKLVGKIGQLTLLAALDVTDVRVIVRRNLMYALAVLAVAAAVSVGLGSRLASVMSSALRAVNVALKKVEELDYVHVEPIRTGDELEDLASGFNRMVDGLRERDKLRTTFGKYMTSAVIEHLLAGKVALGGESLTVTVLFTDIRGFTSISEKMAPQQLVALLNEYFTEMVGIVMQEDGVVDKYIGDAIMAVFGAPVPKPNDATNAVRAAVRMRKALGDLNARLEARGIAPLRTGIGIHSGEVVAGNIGCDRRMEYTVIGDTVNVASRLETSTKELGVEVLISESTFELTKDLVEVGPEREIAVKGRERPVLAYQVLGLRKG
jgi:adenylate cyclase